MNYTLRKWVAEDYNYFFLYSNSVELYRNMSDSFPHTLEACKRTVALFADNDETKLCVRAIVINGQPVGCIGGFFERDIYDRNVEIAYWIGETYWGQGIMSRVIRDFSHYLFENYPINRIFARPFAYNLGSRKALEHAGFELEGILRKSVHKKNDGEDQEDIFDSCMYALTRN